MKLLFINPDRSWDGKDPKTMQTYGANIVLCNHLRIQAYWKEHGQIGEKSKPYVNFSVYWIHNNKNNHYSLAYIRIYPKRDYKAHCDLTHDIKGFFKRIWNWRKLREIQKAIEDCQQTMNDICGDPMCGCPEDFASDFNRKIHKLSAQYDKLST